ncbi:MAG: DUF2971 domain-containing protein [Gammaproteobacteria bacterium]|nr:DUF2971 domain-containing protein [Gammaproteobacteria bacterium]MCF6261059.1 DUF2971 domain-containing protein [Gammaproteobacteria bacterium]
MKLFKLQSLNNDGLFYTLDMIINRRIFLATRELMNDINEGQWNCEFEITGRNNIENRKVAEEFKACIDSQRFTCFLEKINSNLMWAHYAGGFSGIALEFDFEPNKYDIRKIDYIGAPSLSLENANSVINSELLPQDIGILKQKEKCWVYEDEWRLYGNSQDKYINNIKPSAIVFGARNTKHYQLLEKLLRPHSIVIKYMEPTNNTEFSISE